MFNFSFYSRIPLSRCVYLSTMTNYFSKHDKFLSPLFRVSTTPPRNVQDAADGGPRQDKEKKSRKMGTKKLQKSHVMPEVEEGWTTLRTFFIKLRRLILGARRRVVKRGKRSWQPFPQEDASPRIVYDLSTFVFLLLYPSFVLAARERFQRIRELIEILVLLAKWIEIVDLAGRGFSTITSRNFRDI